MSDPQEQAVEALESSLRAIDASLSVLVVARENCINALKTIQAPPAKNPHETMGQPMEACGEEHKGPILEAGRGAGVCDACGEEVPWPAG
jgi:hypothetical protein